MLNLANGGHSHVINPSGSNFDSQVERLTLLRLYGGNLAADATAPVLSLPTGTKTGSTTASGTVSTDEGNGTLYFWATTSATETAANIKANGSSPAVPGTGAQTVPCTGLTAETVYYAHSVQDDAATNESNVVNSSSFTTDAAVAPSTGTSGGGGGGRFFAYPIEEGKSPQVYKIEEEIRVIKKQKATVVREQLKVNVDAFSKAANRRSAGILAALNEQLQRLEQQRSLQLALEKQARDMEKASIEAKRVKRMALRKKRLKMLSILIQ